MRACKRPHQCIAKFVAAAGLSVATVLLVFLQHAAPAFGRVQAIETRPGVTVTFMSEMPAGATALVLLFEGGPGLLQPGYEGFAHKAYPILLRHGFAAALIDAPTGSDGFRGGLNTRFRESPEHIADADAVIRSLKQSYALPIWILGISNGTRSAANYAIHRSTMIAGLILLSSSTDPPFGEPIQNLPGIKSVSVPLLAIAHLDDACLGSPPAGAPEIAKAATGSPAAMAMLFTGGLAMGPAPCGVETHHVFYGMEEDVVSAIVAFISQHATTGAQLSTAQQE